MKKPPGGALGAIGKNPTVSLCSLILFENRGISDCITYL